jgi:hypothetical protein
MRTGSPAPRGPSAAQLQGPMSLERARCCLGCEAIFTGSLARSTGSRRDGMAVDSIAVFHCCPGR